MGSLEGKHCLVTGGTSGIGRATVELFAACNAKAYSVKKKQSINVCLLVVKVYFDERLDVLVNNAGLYVMKGLMEMNDEEYDRVMDTNLHAAYNLCKMCYPFLKASNAGSVINIGSAAGGPRPSASFVPYAMSKGAIHQFTRCLSNEWASENIRVNCVAPGVVHTPLTAHSIEEEGLIKIWSEEAPMKRVGQPEDIAKAVKFFATDDSSFVTGQVLYVDGGYSVRGLGY